MLLNPGVTLTDLQNRFSSSVCAVNFRDMEVDNDYTAKISSVSLGALDICHSYGRKMPLITSRTKHHVEVNPVDDFLLCLPTNFSWRVVQGGRNIIVSPGHFAFLNTQRPFEAGTDTATQQNKSHLILRMSGALLRRQIPHIDECCAIELDASNGIGKVFKSILKAVINQSECFTDIQSDMFGTMIFNTALAYATEAPELVSFAHSSRELAQSQLRRKAINFVENNLSDFALDPDMVAKRCGISLRTLYAAFESSETTVGALIRELRLRRCRETLLNSAFEKHSISQIALRCGFANLTNFTRVYREYFGVPPREDRRTAALRQPPRIRVVRPNAQGNGSMLA